jgi:hypothetical protein
MTASQVLLGLIAGIVALAIGAVLLKPLWFPLWTLFRRTQQFLEDWFGEPERPGQKARPGAMARLAQLETNGGTSMRDAIARIERKVTDTAAAAREAVSLAHEAAVLAGRAAAEAATSSQRAQEQHVENVARLDALERDREAGLLRERALSACLHELGLDIELDRPA